MSCKYAAGALLFAVGASAFGSKCHKPRNGRYENVGAYSTTNCTTHALFRVTAPPTLPEDAYILEPNTTVAFIGDMGCVGDGTIPFPEPGTRRGLQ